MRLLPKTWALIGVAVALGVANAWTIGPVAAPDALPALPAVVPDDVTKIVISSPIDRLEIDRTAFDKGHPEAERWQIVAPLDYAADVAQVRALLRIYGLGVPMDARIDAGNLKDYQLEDQDAKVVELYTNAATPALQVIVGRTVGPSTSFVRLPGADTVYRAAVGPRQRYDQPAADWRDKVVLDVDKDAVTDLGLQAGASTLLFARAPTAPGAEATWTLTSPPSAGFALDSGVVESVARALGRIRAGDIHNGSFPGGFEAPLAVATLGTATARHTITLGSASDDKTAFVKVDERPDVFAVSGQLTHMLTQPQASFRNRGVFHFDPDTVRRMALTEGSITIEIERAAGDDKGDGWTVLRPANMDVDGHLADALTGALSTLRAAGIPADDAFIPGAGRLVITFADGTAETLELGQPEVDTEGRKLARVRTRSGLYQLKLQQIGEIERVFGR